MPITPHSDGIKLAIRLTPKASKNAIGQVAQSADGSFYLKATVTTVPEDGKANKALVKLLAKALKLPSQKISIASGATNRNKYIVISGDAQDLKQKFKNLIGDYQNDRNRD